MASSALAVASARLVRPPRSAVQLAGRSSEKKAPFSPTTASTGHMRAMWSHQPAGRPVTATTRRPAAAALHRARRPRAVSRPSVVSVSSMSNSTHAYRRALELAQRLQRPITCATRCALRFGHVQAALRPAPEHVLGGARPFVPQPDSAARARSARRRSPRRGCPSPSTLRRSRAVAAQDAGPRRVGHARVAREERVEAAVRDCRQVAAGQRRRARSTAPHPGKVRRQHRQRMLGEAAIGGDLAAEHREQRRRAGVVVEPSA